MICINYLDNLQIRKDIELLFVSAFPKNERPPADIFFRDFVDSTKSALFGFYDENTFVGFASVILYKDICYIFFLAVSSEQGNKGYGSKILAEIKAKYKNKVILLCYEEVGERYPDNEMRIRRMNFYKRNGFVDNPLKTDEFGVIFQTAYYGHRTVSFAEYQKIFSIGFGEWTLGHLKEYK